LLLVTVHVLEQVGLQVAAAAGFDQFEQGHEREVVVHRMLASGHFVETLKQVFQAQKSAHAFVERMFVKNHARK
jgi:Fe-S cluster assembly scaffold protein SufB